MEEWIQPWTRRRASRGKDHFAARHLERIRPKLAKIEAPVLVVWGEQDDIFPLRHALRMIKELPQAEMHTIMRCGHWATLDAPEELSQLYDTVPASTPVFDQLAKSLNLKDACATGAEVPEEE